MKNRARTKECEVCRKSMDENKKGWTGYLRHGRCKKCQNRLIKIKKPYNK